MFSDGVKNRGFFRPPELQNIGRRLHGEAIYELNSMAECPATPICGEMLRNPNLG